MNKYEIYKKVEIQWIRKIPAHWRIERNKNIFIKTKSVVGIQNETTDLLSLTTKGIKVKSKDQIGGKQPSSYKGYQFVNKDNLVLCLFDLDCSAVFSDVSQYNGMISPAYDVFKVEKQIPQYYKYLFSYLFQDRVYKIYSKSVRYTITEDNFNTLLSLVPPLEEQQQIANYLDWKIREIDQLIETEKQKIEEMELYKKIFIDNFLKKKKKIKYRLKDIFTANDDYIKISSEEDYIRYIEIGDVGTNKLKNKPTIYRISEAPSRAKRLVKENDIILSTVRTYLKSILKIDNSIEDCVVSTGFVVLRPKEKFLNSNYLEYALMVDEFLDQVISNSIGISYPAISEEKILALSIYLPEDNDGAIELKKFESKFENFKNNSENIIMNLNMLRESIISEVVTGQIDVRNVKIPERK